MDEAARQAPPRPHLAPIWWSWYVGPAMNQTKPRAPVPDTWVDLGAAQFAALLCFLSAISRPVMFFGWLLFSAGYRPVPSVTYPSPVQALGARANNTLGLQALKKSMHVHIWVSSYPHPLSGGSMTRMMFFLVEIIRTRQ